MANEIHSTNDAELDLGEPIAELAEHVVPAPSHLLRRVRSSIFRRTLAADVTRLATWGPWTAFLELLKALFDSLGLADRAPTTEPDEDG